MKRHTRMITAQGNDSLPYVLYIYTNDASAQVHPHSSIIGESTIELATSDGQLVRWRAKGLYEIVGTGIVLRSYALDAP